MNMKTIRDTTSQKSSEVNELGKNSTDDIKFSISPNLGKDLDDVLSGERRERNNDIYIGESSKILTDVTGAEKLQVTMPVKKAYAATVSEEQAKKDGRYDKDLNYHDLGKQGLLNVLNASENPAMVIVPREGKQGILWDRLLLVTNQTDSNINNIVVVQKIQTSANIENKTVKSNKIVTAYGKDTLQNQIKEAGSDNRILYLNKNKSQLSGNVGEGRSLAEYTTVDFDDNIKQFWESFNYLRNKKSVNKDLSKSLEGSKRRLFDGIDTSNLLKNSLKVKTESDTDLKSMQKENSYLKRKVESLKEEFKLTKGYEPNPADISRVANRLKVDLKSTYDRQALKDNLTKIFKYINEYNGENTAEVCRLVPILRRTYCSSQRALQVR